MWEKYVIFTSTDLRFPVANGIWQNTALNHIRGHCIVESIQVWIQGLQW